MYHIAVEARLTGPASGMEAAWQMIADYAINVPEPLLRNEAHICLVNALKKIIMDGSKGVAGTTTIASGNIKGATVRAGDTLSKEALRPLARLAQSILAFTGCVLDVVITQVYGSGPYTVSHVVTHTIHPSVEKRHRTLKVSVLTPPTLGLEG